ncbi:hypothetical protein [Hyphomonas sp.]|uniref:hypothetical protein n=1 Tax=Hyphomonas sp. TaxID=87 RepID=UPI0025BD9E45|nr:hypothetical protein [Hyphomonas sp.]
MTEDKSGMSILVAAGLLQGCLRLVLPRRPSNRAKVKDFAITLKFDRGERIIEVMDARHEVRSCQFPVFGEWPEDVQVEGNRLRALLDKFSVNDQIDMCARAQDIEIRSGKFKMSLARLDGQKRIEPRPLPQQIHAGKVEVKIDSPNKRVALDDTWGFSARVPMPQHREKLK